MVTCAQSNPQDIAVAKYSCCKALQNIVCVFVNDLHVLHLGLIGDNIVISPHEYIAFLLILDLIMKNSSLREVLK